MEQHEFLQGSPDWHQHRRTHYNASDAPAMLGISQYKTRNQLLHEMATGITPEVDAATQRRFDYGHIFEALARPLAEQIIGKKLYPVIGSEGKLSASFDGLTADDSVAFEHKTLSSKLATELSGGHIAEQYRAQMEQQLMLSGAGKCLFMASTWDDANELTAEMHQWYESDPDMRDRLLQGWCQFAIDLENFQHIEHIEKPKADVCIELPALFIHARGQITDSNMQAYGEAITVKLAEVRAIKLVTDQDFSNAKEAAKLFREQCKKLELAKEAMLSQTVTIGDAARMMDAWHEDLRQTALKLEKDVEREDLAKKRVMVGEAGIAFTAHCEALEAETRPVQLNVPRPDFAEAIKRKRNYASMQGALDDALAQGKITAGAIAKDVRAKLAWCEEHAAGMSFLFPDLQQIITKPMDDFALTISSRIKAHQEAEAERVRAHQEAAVNAERARIQAEEEAKAKAAAQKSIDEAVSAGHARLREDRHQEDERAKATQEAARIVVVKELERPEGRGFSEQYLMSKFFSYDPDDGFRLHATESEAKERAQNAIDIYRDDADDGWAVEVEGVCWGNVRQHVAEVNIDNHDDESCDYELADVPHPLSEGN